MTTTERWTEGRVLQTLAQVFPSGAFALLGQVRNGTGGSRHNLKGMAIISGYGCDLYRELYGDWERVEAAARSMLNVPRTECLWISPRAQGRRQGRLGL